MSQKEEGNTAQPAGGLQVLRRILEDLQESGQTMSEEEKHPPFDKLSCKELALLGDGLDCVVDERTGVRSEAYIDAVESLRAIIRSTEKQLGCKDSRPREERY